MPTDTITYSTYEKVQRLLKFATGDEYGDGEIVTAVIDGYAEPGYGTGDDVVVLGNWNTKRHPHDGEPPLTLDESMPARLARSLERVGAKIEWLDEWTECQGCYGAVRMEADSYSWKPYYALVYNELLCADCLRDMGEDALTEYIGDASKCLTWCEPSHVESFGFVKWEPGDEHTYESGWHPGQDDTPQPILDDIRRAYPNAEVVFFLDESSQFYVRFSAYFRLPSED